MDKFPPEAWQRLGKALERRRGQLGFGFRRRTEFAEGKRLSAKTLARLEHAERDYYPDDTIALAEVIYGWQPGSIEAVLRGGEPEPLPGTPGGDEPDSRPKLVRDNWGDENVQRFWGITGISERARLGHVVAYIKDRDEGRATGA
jgi:hypothetical protein